MQQRKARVHAGCAGNLPFDFSPATLPGAMWCVYLLRCADGSLYTGITNDLSRRIAAHRRGRGARYTRGRGPLALVHAELAASRSAALRREHELKRLRRREKLAFLDRRENISPNSGPDRRSCRR